jgi:hypothetical protein
MGLIMLILIGTVPTAYALNRCRKAKSPSSRPIRPLPQKSSKRRLPAITSSATRGPL